MSSTDVSARINPRADFLLLLQKIIMVVVFSFFRSGEDVWFLVTKLTALSSAIFLRYYLSKPYHNDKINIIYSICTLIFWWANSCLFISQVLSETTFNGGLELFFLGIPLVVSLIIYARDKRVELLMINASNF